MASRRGFLVILMLLMTLIMTACFQEAGEPLQSTGSTVEPITDFEQGAPTVDVMDGAVTEEPFIEDAIGEVEDDPFAPTSIPLTVISQPTSLPDLPQPSTATPLPGEEATPGQFITPMSPLVPTVDQAAPTGPVPFDPQGDLITPTSFLDSSGQPITEGGAGSATVDERCVYVVQAGDNLYRIALSNDTTIEQMRSANPALSGENPVLQIGQQLVLPGCLPEGATGQVQVQPTVPPPANQPTQPAGTGGQQTYTVQSGDTLFTIATRFNTTISALQQANQLANPNRLDVGQVLIIPE